MSHHRPQKRAGHAQRVSPNMWNPNNSRALQALEERPYLAAQYLEGIKEEEEAEEADVQVLDISDSISSNATETEDESGYTAGLLLSQTEGHPLYIPEGRRIVNNGCTFRPYPKVDIMLTTLNFVMTAIGVACAAEGTYFTVPKHNHRASNSFGFPLQGMKADLWDLYHGLEAWSRRITQMRSEYLKFEHYIRTSPVQLTDQARVSMIYKALRRVDDLTDGYLHPYSGVPLQLEPVNVELQKIMFLLTSIVEEGNTLAGKEVQIDQDATRNDIDAEVDSTEQQDGKTDDVDTPIQSHDAVATNDHFVLDDPLSRPATPHDPHTPTWKQSLPHLPSASLYVGRTELKIFRAVLALANEVQRALVSVVRLCEALRRRGRAMRKIWESWSGFVEAWKATERADREEPKATGYDMGR